MGTPEDQGMQINQINLTCEDAAKLASDAIQDDADSLILLLMGIMEKPSHVDAHMLIYSAIYELVRSSSVYTDLRDDYIRVIVRKYRQK